MGVKGGTGSTDLHNFSGKSTEQIQIFFKVKSESPKGSV